MPQHPTDKLLLHLLRIRNLLPEDAILAAREQSLSRDLPLLEVLRSERLLTPALLAELETATTLRLHDATEPGADPPIELQSTLLHALQTADGLLAPTDLTRHYLLGRVLGAGGMGTVTEAQDRLLHRSMAVKQLGAHTDRLSRARFLREVQITAQLNHPGVVPIYDLGRDAEGIPYYAMRHVRGRSLADLIGELAACPELADRPLDLAQLLLIYRQLCQVIAYAHSRGVVHRDLKPANVLVGHHGEVVVIDWGLAKVLTDPYLQEPGFEQRLTGVHCPLTRQGESMGTPGYMAPEQADGLGDERSDVFALGVILFELLTLRKPYGKGTILEALTRSLQAPPSPSRQWAWPRETADQVQQPVGTLEPNAFGLYDMHGNVAEWCADYFASYELTPTDGRAMLDARLGLRYQESGFMARVYRGGSVVDALPGCAASKRQKAPEGHKDNMGFRPACSVLPLE